MVFILVLPMLHLFCFMQSHQCLCCINIFILEGSREEKLKMYQLSLSVLHVLLSEVVGRGVEKGKRILFETSI